MPDDVGVVIVMALGLAALCALSVAIPQAVLLVRLARKGEGIALWTLKTVLWTGSLGLALGWRFLVWVDFTQMDQRVLGTIDQRWPVEATLTMLVAAACIYAAGLYHGTVTFAKRGAS